MYQNTEIALTEAASTYVAGHLANAIWLDTSGAAWLGTLSTREDGTEFVDGITVQGADVAAPDGWEAYQARTLGAEAAPGTPAFFGCAFSEDEMAALEYEFAGPALAGALAARDNVHGAYDTMNLDAYANLMRYSH